MLAKRTVVRDPRKKAANNARLAPMSRAADDDDYAIAHQQNQRMPSPIPQQPASTGATLGFYMVAGVGVSLGFALVGALLG